MSIQVEKIHLRDANDWVALPEWTYESAGGSTVVLSDILEGSSSSYYGVCETAAGTVAKEAFNVKTKTGKTLLYADLYNGLTITIRFVNSNTASNPTLNVNSIGNFPIYRYGTTAAGANIQSSWPANGIVSLTYDNALRAQGCWILNDVNYDTNTDTKVTQTVTSTDGDYPIILKATTATATVTSTTIFGAKIKANPNSGNISASTFNGFSLAAAAQKGVDNSVAADSTSTNLPTTSAVATALPKASASASKNIATTSSAGTTAAGTPYAAWNHVHAITKATVTSALGYTPPTTDTDTHYTSKNIVTTASTATANASVTSGSIYLNHLEESTVVSSHKITPTGATTVTADSSGNITIKSTDTKNTAGATTTTGQMYLIGATATGANPQTYANTNVYATNGALHATTFNGLTLATAATGFTISGGTTSKTLTVSTSVTLAAAAGKGVDNSVAAGSSSTNLPTTSAVAAIKKVAITTAATATPTGHEEIWLIRNFGITQQPQNVTINALGETVNFYVETGDPNATYQWQGSTTSSSLSNLTDSTIISGSKTNILSIVTSASAIKYVKCNVAFEDATTATTNTVHWSVTSS